MNKFFYELGLYGLALLSIPKLFQKKYRKSWKQRLGIGFPTIKKEGRPLIWIHAVSVGETKAIATVAKKLKERSDHPLILISSITETGHAEAIRSLPFADYHVYLPLDLSRIIRPIVRKLKPNLVIVTETDFWFNFLEEAKRQGAKIALINGKISERSLKRYKRFPSFTRPLFSLFDHFCVQSQHYTKRFLDLGINPDKITVTGNLKLDSTPPFMDLEEEAEWKKSLGITENDLVLTLGSTHAPEEKMLLSCLPSIPNLKILLIPRHPERFDEVAKILEDQNINYFRLSKKNPTGSEKVILIDAMGMLWKCYQISHVSIVAGSFTPKVGGHNIIEPLFYGSSLIYGPFMHAQPELDEIVQNAKAGLKVDPKDLSQTIQRLLSSPDERHTLNHAALLLIKNLQGSTEATIQIIDKLKNN